jgi:ABC-type amino acid transport substrate-binding protein
MFSQCSRVIIIALVSLIFCGCNTTSNSTKDSVEFKSPDPPLLVGVTPDFPPIVFKQAEKITGVEADLARRLAEELNKSIQFVELRWAQLIPALLEGKIDIIMSGMSITKARQVRIRFTEHYFKSGQLAAFRTEDTSKYDSIDSVINSKSVIGVVKGSTGDVFVKKNFPNADRIFELAKASDGAFDLNRRTIDLFVNDAPSIIWMVSENEADIMGLWQPLNEEYLAWGVRGDDQEFLTEVNNILKKWKEDGTLDGIMKKWVPYFEKLK